ncbi:hypothetical protein R3P38DRAFT_2369189, partial [Favolaschia claudopus]
LEAIRTSAHTHEVRIGQLLSAAPHWDNPRNHCISILDVLQDPDNADLKFIVMHLCIQFNYPLFDTVGEVVHCRNCSGFQFQSEFGRNRDCNFTNFVEDPDIYPDGKFHPASPWVDSTYQKPTHPITRTECWPRVSIIDFGLSRQYDPSFGPPRFGGDNTPPEHRTPKLKCNPFPTDIYFLGNLMR